MRRTPALHITYDVVTDFLSGVRVGKVLGDRPMEEIQYLSEDIRLIFEPHRQTPVGFEARNSAVTSLDDVDQIVWDDSALAFDVPALGLQRACLGAVVEASRYYLRRGTPDAAAAWRAIEAEESGELEKAIRWWQASILSGSAECHFQIGRVLHLLGDERRAYAHLRYFTEAHPEGSWGWTWRGVVCEPLGAIAESMRCFERAIRLEHSGRTPTDAAERLLALRLRLDSLVAEAAA